MAGPGKIYHANGGYEDGAFLSKESPYRSFFGFQDENGWPDNTSYEGWWDYDTLPKLNYEGSEELYDYILGIAAKMGVSTILCRWLAAGCCGGFRSFLRVQS
ncbi:amylopullulanase [human gut metagenome]|uniref:Amylopullulanase n=1 Tax=human gut metagenome TaxID=408170 RepID=K1S1X2_9ZZZZ